MLLGFLTGATACGKSAVALELATLHRLEILSVDSRQVYRGLDIGTAKPTQNERARVRHHLIDLLEPHEGCSAGRFGSAFEEALADIGARRARGIAVGGTGLYWEALSRGLHTLPAASAELRARHAEILKTEGVEGLRKRLTERDPATAARIGARDQQRISRALEVAELSGRSLIELTAAPRPPGIAAGTPVVVLCRARDDLYRRIESRCLEMLAAGLLEEIERLLAHGASPDAPAFRTVGYRQLLPVVLGRADQQGATEAFIRETRRYAKRQETWFRHRLSDATFLPVGEGETPGATARHAAAALGLDRDAGGV